MLESSHRLRETPAHGRGKESGTARTADPNFLIPYAPNHRQPLSASQLFLATWCTGAWVAFGVRQAQALALDGEDQISSPDCPSGSSFVVKDKIRFCDAELWS